MNKFFLLSLLLLLSLQKLFAQKEYVASENPVYNFLERMYEQKIITDYNSFEVPKTRSQVAGYLKTIESNKSALNKTDRMILNDLLIEFEYDVFGTLDNSDKIIGGKNYNIFSDEEKYLFYDAGKKGNSLFINLLGEGEFLTSKISSLSAVNSELGIIGGEIRGTVNNKFGFSLRGTNGYAFGDRNAALLRKELRYNFKFNETSDSRFFDNTEGYLTADFDAVRFKIGRDRLKVGYSPENSFFTASPLFDYLGMNINYSILTFSWFHGKIQGPKTTIFDSVSGNMTTVVEKYIGYHRLGFNITDYFQLGLGEFIIYSDRPLDFAYLNPFNFYKSAEHSGSDRDNSLIFIDGSAVLTKGLKFYADILIDDIDFSKIGKGWYGNQFSYTAGLSGSLFYSYLPLNFNTEYRRTEPYVFTHRLLRNNFTDAGYPLYENNLPNSEMIYMELSHNFNHRLFSSISIRYTIHGDNPVQPDGSVINVGGDVNLGHRISDKETVNFLSGYREYFRNFSAIVGYEPFNNILLSYRLNYVNNSRQLQSDKELQSYLLLTVKI